MRRGYLQVYTGDGKGKTTAAIGLAVRALGAGLSVCMVQFIKSMPYAELGVLRRLGVSVHQFGRGCFIRGEPTEADRAMAARGLAFVETVYADRALGLLILDEINVAIHLGLVQTGAVLETVSRRPASLELVCTGRGAPPELLAAADLATRMECLKHYYDRGVAARDGIER